MPEIKRTPRNRIGDLLRDERGAVAGIFAVSLPVLLGFVGAAADYSNLSVTRNKLQAVADSAALAGAREFRLGNTTSAQVSQAVSNYAQASLTGLDLTANVTPSADTVRRTISVNVTATVPTYVMHLMGNSTTRLEARATARMVGGSPICVIGLDPNAPSTLELDQTAKLEAPTCALYSNSKNRNGLIARADAKIVAAFICSAGGRSSKSVGSFTPSPQTDCPVMPDPLLSRPQPVAGGCMERELVIKSGTVTLKPGTYCDGLKITGGAKVTLSPGVYIFKKGKLQVEGGASLTGVNVGLHFTGDDAALRFEAASTISLTAPKTGDMAGILISEDRGGGDDAKKHEILSDDARTLLGTIYLPRGFLIVGANKPVADKSAYTIVVARRFTLGAGPTMVLNTNYGATDVPVPNGVGPNGTQAVLTN